MQKKFTTAFRVAVLLSGLAGCTDAPVAPRQQSRGPEQNDPVSFAHADAFSGARADSVLRALDAGWDHGEARQRRIAWRRAHGVPDSIGDPGLPKPIVMQPDRLLVTDGGSPRPASQIIAHYEALHFGHVDQYMNVPDGVEAEVTFIGDQAEIVLGSLTITGDNGSQYQKNGRIAMGPGQLTSCTDILLSSCDFRRHLNGALILSGAPVCDANGSGSVSYYITNLNVPLGSSGADGPVSANAPIGTAAPRCPIADTTKAAPTTNPSDTTSDTPTVPEAPGGSPAGPPPIYDGPGAPPLPPSYPPPRTDGAPEDFWCQTTNTYVWINGVKTLFTTVIDCHRSGS